VTNADGYVHVAKVPAGATFIELREHSKNHIGARLESLTLCISWILSGLYHCYPLY